MKKNFFEKNKRILLYFLISISAFSFFNTFIKGMINGCDFQWRPAVLFWKGINHYQQFILNNGGDFLCQNGEYAHLLSVLLYPFTLVEWETARLFWLTINVFLVFIIPLLVCKHLRLSKYQTILLVLIFITCYPTRMNLNYGQQSIFVLFFMILPFILNSKFASFFSGFSYVKYSSGYIIFLNFIIEKKYKYLFISIIPYLTGWTIYFSLTNTDPIINFFEPFELILKNEYSRDGDIYSLINIYFLSSKSYYYKLFAIILIFVFNFLFLWKLNKIKDVFFKMSFVFICPLIFFPHSNYDYVLLFPLLCYSVYNFKYLINKINVCYVIYIFYLNRIIKHLIDFDVLYQPLMLLLTILLVITNIYSFNKERNLYLFNYKLI